MGHEKIGEAREPQAHGLLLMSGQRGLLALSVSTSFGLQSGFFCVKKYAHDLQPCRAFCLECAASETKIHLKN